MKKEFFVRILCLFVPIKAWRRSIREYFLYPRFNRTFFSSVKNYGKNNKVVVKIDDNRIISNPHLEGLKIIFKGSNNTIEIDSPDFFINQTLFEINGSNNSVKIKEGWRSWGIHICMSNYQTLNIGKGFSCGRTDICLQDESYNQVTIGDDCMFSDNILIRPSDGHTIYDINTGVAQNKPQKGIFIGNHVWLCRDVYVLKDVSIADNSIIGCKSLVTNDCEQENAVYAGTPTQIVRENVNWSKDNTEVFQHINAPEIGAVND